MREPPLEREEQRLARQEDHEAAIAVFMNSLRSAMANLLCKHAALILKLTLKGSSSHGHRLSSDEQTDLMELWYKGHRLMQLYQFYCQCRGNSTITTIGGGGHRHESTGSDHERSQSQDPGEGPIAHASPPNQHSIRHTYMEKCVLVTVVQQLHALPLYCPVSISLDEISIPSRPHPSYPSRRRADRDAGSMKRPPGAATSAESGRNYSATVDDFHSKVKVRPHTYAIQRTAAETVNYIILVYTYIHTKIPFCHQVRVQFLVESLLGKTVMKANLRQLKDCCYRVASAAQTRTKTQSQPQPRDPQTILTVWETIDVCMYVWYCR